MSCRGITLSLLGTAALAAVLAGALRTGPAASVDAVAELLDPARVAASACRALPEGRRSLGAILDGMALVGAAQAAEEAGAGPGAAGDGRRGRGRGDAECARAGLGRRAGTDHESNVRDRSRPVAALVPKGRRLLA